MAQDSELVQWLVENGSPAIRYRAATELADDPRRFDLDGLRVDLVQSQMVGKWVDRLVPVRPGDIFSLHGSHPDAFENVCAKLCELGIRPGMLVQVDEYMQGFRDYLAHGQEYWGRPLLAACLNWAGYGDDSVIQAHVSERLSILYELALSGTYDIYIDHDTFGDCAAAFRKRPLVNPEYNGRLPGIWDIYAMAHLPKALQNDETAYQIETVISYILHPGYQALNEGYGYMRSGPRRYWSMGWSVHLPGYKGLNFERAFHEYMFVQRLELMAHFPVARRSQWFVDSMAHLEGFRTEQGIYRFPARYLREQPTGYWVQGAYMRLEENRRARQSLTLDSTFRMLKIKKLCGDGPVQ